MHGRLEDVMSKFLGLLLGALAIGIVVGVVFQFSYPTIEISPDLGLLFALVGLVLSWLIRAALQALRGR
jgi:divalent metal cation (Fe/Co/Zn/Cd) transporter